MNDWTKGGWPLSVSTIGAIKMETPEDFLRRMFVDEVLPEVGDVVELVVSELSPAKGVVVLKYRVVRAADTW